MSSVTLPTTTQAVIVKKSASTEKPVYHDASLESREIPALKENQVLLKMAAVAFNHRDVWIRKGMYPGIGFGSVFGSDGAGTVVASPDPQDSLLNKRVFMTPMRGWKNEPDAPPDHNKWGVIGGGKYPDIGTFAEYVAVERDEIIPTPEHFDDVQAAAWPLGGLTAWRASMVNGKVEQGHNVLITGIGGGVAITALQLCVAKGANVYVTSGSQDKLDKAKELGAKAGASYKEADWASKLLKGITLDAIIDSGGGDIVAQAGVFLKSGGRYVVYGMTATPTVTFTMREVMRNQQLIGSTMGSQKDLEDATAFAAQHKIVPIVHDVIEGLSNIEKGFETMRQGEQFGKIVVRVSADSAKL